MLNFKPEVIKNGSLIYYKQWTMERNRRMMHTHKLHLLKKSGANRKQAYADREEFTDRRASYKTKRKKRKKRVLLVIYAKRASTGSNKAVCRVGGSVDVVGSTSPHLPEALCRAPRQSWTENGSLWPALNGTRTHACQRQIDRERETVIAVTMLI